MSTLLPINVGSAVGPSDRPAAGFRSLPYDIEGLAALCIALAGQRVATQQDEPGESKRDAT